VPVPAATQRKALDVLARGVLASDAFRLSPGLQRKLAPDYADRGDAPFSAATDYSIAGIVVSLQRALLGQLMSDGVATLLLDSEGKFDRDKGGKADAFRLSELYGRLTSEVWGELDAGAADIPGPRRELQREHVNRIAQMVLRPSPAARADARSLVRMQAQGLVGRISAASKRASLSAEARAHLQDSAETLQQALAAKLLRLGL